MKNIINTKCRIDSALGPCIRCNVCGDYPREIRLDDIKLAYKNAREGAEPRTAAYIEEVIWRPFMEGDKLDQKDINLVKKWMR